MTAVPKVPSKGGSFLPGVREDLMNVQTLIKNDPHKTLAYTFMDFPGRECLRPREEYLQHIEVFLQGCKTPGGELSFHGSFVCRRVYMNVCMFVWGWGGGGGGNNF